MDKKEEIVFVIVGITAAAVIGYLLYRKSQTVSTSSTVQSTTTTTPTTSVSSTSAINTIPVASDLDSTSLVAPDYIDAHDYTTPIAVPFQPAPAPMDLAGIFYEYLRRVYSDLFTQVFQFNASTWGSSVPQNYSLLSSTGRNNCSALLSQWIISSPDQYVNIFQTVAGIYNANPSGWAVNSNVQSALQQRGYLPFFNIQ